MAALRIQIADGGAGGAARQIAAAPDSVVAVHAGDRIEVSGAVIVGAWITGDDVTLRFDDGTARSFDNLALHLGRADGVSVVSNGGSRVIESLDDLKSLTVSGPEPGTGGSLGPRPAVIPGDPGFANQWHLDNTSYPGIDLNVTGVWDEFTGNGVVVAAVDDGIDYTHADLAGNYRADLDYDARDGDSDSFASAAGDAHGTTVLGVIGASLNGSGVVGVAPGADITMFRMGFGADGSDAQLLTQMQNMAGVDVANNSWGFDGFFGDDFGGAYASHGVAIENAVSTGRGGLGTVITFAAGNSYDIGDDVNYHSFQNSPHTIAVAAIGQDGTVASFSTPGAAILVSAPGTGIYTTDHTGSAGYAAGDFVSVDGTSFSSPMVAGVAALMLEANPDLGYRDVQEILTYSAVQTTTDAGWQTNGAGNWNGGGLTVSHDFGFGLVDARAAVRLAETWDGQATFANRASLSLTSAPASAILDNQSTSDTITFASGLEIDYVQVAVDISHTWIGDLTVALTSPEGTVSTLVNRPGVSATDPFGTGQDNIDFMLSSTQFWGETGVGTWTLSVSDSVSFDTGTFNAWTLTLLGDALTADDVYVYTDEWASAGADAARQTVADAAGTDTLNFAAVTAGFALDLAPGAANTLYGNAIAIDAATVIENAIGGDGADSITGNDAANVLSGMRGADTLAGGAGDDLLVGGAGDDLLAGGAGSDTAVYSGLASAYAVAFDGTTGTVTGAEGTDTITGIEWLQFADGTQAVESNDPPVAVDDTATTVEDTPVTITAAALLANDSDPEGDALSLVSVGNAVNGSVALDGAGDVVFTPDADFNGAASFEYTVSDGNTASTASVAVTVNPVNDAPVADDDSLSAEKNTPITISAADLLANDADVDGDALAIAGIGGALNASVALDANGDIQFTPDPDFIGAASFQYTLTDGNGGTATATVSVDVLSGITLVGGAGADILTGHGGDDTLIGNDGADTLAGGAGTDMLSGGAGDDTYVYAYGDGSDTITDTGGADLIRYTGPDMGEDEFAGVAREGDDFVISFVDGSAIRIAGHYAGNAVEQVDVAGEGVFNLETGLVGGAARDVIVGTAADDTLFGGDGADFLLGGDGADRLVGGTGADELEGGADNDFLTGQLGDDELWGDAGNDVLAGDSGNDILDGGADNDTLYGGGGADQLSGGDGNDRLKGGAGDDTLDGGAGLDIVTYGAAVDGVIVNLSAAAITATLADGAAGTTVQVAGGTAIDAVTQAARTAGVEHVDTDALSGLEVVIGGAGADVMVGGDAAETLFGGPGADNLSGGAGSDALKGHEGADTLSGGDGDDALSGNAGNDTLFGGNGADVLAGDDGDDQLVGEAGDDSLYGGQGADTLLGGAGDDRLVGHAGDDELRGGDGQDLLFGRDGSDALYGGAANDYLSGGDGDDQLFGEERNDKLLGGAGNDTLDGGVGFDKLYGNAGADTLIGGANKDRLFGGADADVLDGGDDADFLAGDSGNDTLSGGDGDDRLIGGGGNDALDGGLGSDTASYSSATAAVTVDLVAGMASGDAALGTDTLTGIENAVGGAGDDTLTGDGADNTFEGLGGDDVISGGAGSDTAIYATAVASVSIDFGAGTASGGADVGTDTLDSIENAVGGAGADIFTGDGADNTFEGLAGDDALTGGAGSDTASYSRATTAVTVDLAAGTASGDATVGTDTLSSIENAIGGVGDDTLVGSNAANTLGGGNGDDILTGGGGNDTFVFGAGSGADTVTDFSLVDDVLLFEDGIALTGTTEQDANGDGAADTVVDLDTGGSITLLGVSGLIDPDDLFT